MRSSSRSPLGRFAWFAHPAGQIADRAGDDGDVVAALRQVARQLVVAGAAGLAQCDKGLVDQQDMHRLLSNSSTERSGEGPFTGEIKRRQAARQQAHRERRHFFTIGG